VVVTPSSDPIPASCLSTPLFTAFYGAGLSHYLEAFTLWTFFIVTYLKLELKCSGNRVRVLWPESVGKIYSFGSEGQKYPKLSAAPAQATFLR
jgi:hypothetical protein